ncbi:hypothetical protein EW145_g7375 [Phellinidium pouzarii]|uniref:Domain of unknown function at the cortex 1 domain-containing protein n=1 Tax=Phellinidium pouzarii TaxID=167371 RepID=A0A4S4KJY7_9AGAM|nr:hypothetical protein EW145_g7375 [Phellinidium pouzarii]
MKPISANTSKAHVIQSDRFDGRVVVHIKGFPDADGNVLESDYFERPDRQGITWSIQVQGRFLQKQTADDILFGNTFDRPLKLPWGASAALIFMNFIDPTLEHDLLSSEPWALSPLIATMPNFTHTPSGLSPPPFPSKESIGDDISHLASLPSSPSNKSKRPRNPLTSKKRRAHFASPENRRAVQFGPDDVVTTDFCYGFITFPQLSLCLPGGMSFDLMKYWDGQPVRFVCCERPSERRSVADAHVFWCVAIERVAVRDIKANTPRGVLFALSLSGVIPLILLRPFRASPPGTQPSPMDTSSYSNLDRIVLYASRTFSVPRPS